MNKLKNGFGACLFCLTLLFATSSVYAGSLNLASLDWAIDPDKDGDPTGGLADFDIFSYTGFTLVAITNDTGDAGVSVGDTFTDYGYLFPANNGDTTGSLSDVYAITDNMTGTFLTGAALGGGRTFFDVEFDAGSTQTWYDDAGKLLELTLVNGTSTVITNAEGNLDRIGQLDLQYLITDIIRDYFYVEIGGIWVDIWDILNDNTSDHYQDFDSKIYGETVASSSLAESIGSNNEYADELDAVAASILSAFGVSSSTELLNANISEVGATVTINGGQLDLAVVPEPGMLSLMGLAFLGFAGFQSRRKGQRNS